MVKKNLNHNSAFAKSLATAQKNKGKCTIQYQKSASVLEEDTSYPMVVTDIAENEKGYVLHTDVFVDGTPVKKKFFFPDNPDLPFLDNFIDTVAPNTGNIRDVIGVPFEGKITKSGKYDNMEAVGLLDEDFEEEEEN